MWNYRMTLSSQIALEKQTSMNAFKFAKDANEKQKNPSKPFAHVPPVLIWPFYSSHFATLFLRAQTVLLQGGREAGVFCWWRDGQTATDGTYAASPSGSDSSRPEGKLLNLVPPKIMSLPWVLCSDASPKESEPPVQTPATGPCLLWAIRGGPWASWGFCSAQWCAVVVQSHHDSLGFVGG